MHIFHQCSMMRFLRFHLQSPKVLKCRPLLVHVVFTFGSVAAVGGSAKVRQGDRRDFCSDKKGNRKYFVAKQPARFPPSVALHCIVSLLMELPCYLVGKRNSFLAETPKLKQGLGKSRNFGRNRNFGWYTFSAETASFGRNILFQPKFWQNICYQNSLFQAK